MKLVDGQWLTPEGLEVASCVHVAGLEVEGKDLLVRGAARDVTARADRLDGPAFTIRLFSPRTGVIGVRLEHFQGGAAQRPVFALDAEAAPDVEVGGGRRGRPPAQRRAHRPGGPRRARGHRVPPRRGPAHRGGAEGPRAGD